MSSAALPKNFNPRSHKGSDGWPHQTNRDLRRFQSTLPQGERPYRTQLPGIKRDFNPRSHKGSDPFSPRRFLKYSRFQSTLPQGERHFTILHIAATLPISIHAPTRGATNDTATYTDAQLISIHAPTRGATDAGKLPGRRDVDFNPRSHKGSDLMERNYNATLGISIHAPTRGATMAMRRGHSA